MTRAEYEIAVMVKILRTLFVILFVCSTVFSVTGAEGGIGWEKKIIKDIEYLPLAQIEKFYGMEFKRRDGKRVFTGSKSVEMVLHVGSFVCELNGVKFIFEAKIEEADGAVFVSRSDLATLDAVLRPNAIKVAAVPTTVILDPEHGGEAKGVENEFGTEAEFTLKIAKLTEAKLKEKGFDVIMTREDDKGFSLQDRVDIANGFAGDAVFISIGFRSGPRHKQGIETEILSKLGDPAINLKPAATALAAAVHGSVNQRVEKIPDGGISSRRLAVLSNVQHPAILLLPGYMTNEMDSRLIANEKYQEMVAGGITTAMMKYRFTIQRGQQMRKVEDEERDEENGE